MKIIFEAFRNCPKILNYVSIFSIVLYCCNEFWWMELDPLFENANKVGSIANVLFMGLITGHIFYAIVNQVKENSDKSNSAPIISKSIEEIYINATELINRYSQVSDFNPKSIPLSQNDIDKLLQEIENTDKEPNVVYGYPKPTNFTWFQVAETSAQRVKTEINNLMRFSYILDSELMLYLHKIERSEYFFMIDSMVGIGKDFKEFTLFSTTYLTFLNDVNKALKYAFKNRLLIAKDEDLKIIQKIVEEGFTEEELKKLEKK